MLWTWEPFSFCPRFFLWPRRPPLFIRYVTQRFLHFALRCSFGQKLVMDYNLYFNIRPSARYSPKKMALISSPTSLTTFSQPHASSSKNPHVRLNPVVGDKKSAVAAVQGDGVWTYDVGPSLVSNISRDDCWHFKNIADDSSSNYVLYCPSLDCFYQLTRQFLDYQDCFGSSSEWSRRGRWRDGCWSRRRTGWTQGDTDRNQRESHCRWCR